MCERERLGNQHVRIADLFDESTDVSPRRRFQKGANMKEFHMARDDGPLYLEFLKYALNHDHPLATFCNAIYSKTRSKLKQIPLPAFFDDEATQVISHSLSHVRRGEEPFFLFTNFMEAHGPMYDTYGYNDNLYSVPTGWDSVDFDYWNVNLEDRTSSDEDVKRYRELYAASIDYLDQQIVSFIEQLQDETDCETTVIVPADHGENLGYPEDGGLFNHMSSLNESVLHVPLYIINPPKGYDSTEGGYFTHLDFGRLIQDLAHDETPDVFRNRIPAELIGGNLATRKNVPDDRLDYWDRMQRCVYQEEQKFFWDSLGDAIEYQLDHDRSCWQRETATDMTIPDWAEELFKRNINIGKYRAESREHSPSLIDQVTSERPRVPVKLAVVADTVTR